MEQWVPQRIAAALMPQLCSLAFLVCPERGLAERVSALADRPDNGVLLLPSSLSHTV